MQSQKFKGLTLMWDVVDCDVSIESLYNIHRSFRRCATTTARETGVPKDAIEMNNRWRKVENKSGGMPQVPMAELYTEIRQAMATSLQFSKALEDSSLTIAKERRPQSIEYFGS